MDYKPTPQSWREVINGAWKNSFKDIESNKLNLLYIKELKIYTPYIVLCNSGTKRFIFCNVSKAHLSVPYAYNLNDIHQMTLNLKAERETMSWSLELTFPAKFIPQHIQRTNGFIYKWNKEFVTIIRYLATHDIEVIEKQMELLLKECNKFYLLYCDISN